MFEVLGEDSRRGRSVVAGLLYLTCTAVFFLCVDRGRVTEHTPYNHFALLAQSWLDGHLDLPGGPPGYTGNNDFARFEGKSFITFPAFPAVLLLPFVALAGGASAVRDGQVFLWLAGVAPALLFLALERFRFLGLSGRRRAENAGLTLLFAFGSAYFFTAVQGTVWYAAHVVGAALGAAYLLFAIGAERPFLAGLMMGFAFHTRPPLAFGVALFVFEARRVCTAQVSPELRGWEAVRAGWQALDKRRALAKLCWFGVPIVACVLLSFAHNAARFGDPFEVGYRFLDIRWQPRVEKWGLFAYHYLPRNLAVVFTSLPWFPTSGAPFQFSGHGLALWFVTPLYLWLIWPRRTEAPHWALWATVLAVAVPSLCYQNSGWVQFTYRFSNDYAVFLFALLATSGHRFGWLFRFAAAWALGWNLFGALSFERKGFQRYVHLERTQSVLHQPD